MSSLQLIHRELGIPEDYATNAGLALIPEASTDELCVIATTPREIRLLATAAAAWLRMASAAQADGIELVAISGFRSIVYQAEIFRRKLQRGASCAEILRVNLAPGFSEHHSGRALDISAPGSRPLTTDFAETAAFQWLSRHAQAFGFSLSYPEENHRSGLQYEPWHWRWDATPSN